jgi:hypothetical protein
MRRWERLAIAAAMVLQAGCMVPDLPDEGTCRSFAITSWGGGAPWSDLDWSGIAHIDEPLLPIWRSDSDLGNPAWVQAETEKLRVRISDLQASGKMVWLNWASEEQDAVEALGIPLGLNADVVSIDSYGGPWDFPFNTKPRLERVHAGLLPGQAMGLVPEGHFAPDWGVRFTEAEEATVAALYLDWAFQHDRVFALAPFAWGPGPGTMSERPLVAAQYAAAARIYPRC